MHSIFKPLIFFMDLQNKKLKEFLTTCNSNETFQIRNLRAAAAEIYFDKKSKKPSDFDDSFHIFLTSSYGVINKISTFSQIKSAFWFHLYGTNDENQIIQLIRANNLNLSSFPIDQTTALISKCVLATKPIKSNQIIGIYEGVQLTSEEVQALSNPFNEHKFNCKSIQIKLDPLNSVYICASSYYGYFHWVGDVRDYRNLSLGNLQQVNVSFKISFDFGFII